MKLLIAGDYCPRHRVSQLISQGDLAAVFADIKKETDAMDYSIVNLECPVVQNEAKPIGKCGPNLKTTIKGVEALQYAGFNCATLANNHFLDFGEAGVLDTLNACAACGLDVVGGGTDLSEASKVLYKKLSGRILAIINCCEHEFSIASERTAGSNPLNVVKQYYSIREAREKADFVIVIIHGGVEHFWLPTKRMKETYRFFVDAGADAVINHHQHCFSGYEVYKGKPIFYGLGNFCFDGNAQNKKWTSGFMVRLTLDGDRNVKYDIIPYSQCREEAGVRVLQGEAKNAFLKHIETYNAIIANDEANEDAYIKWCSKNEGMYKSALNPFYNKFTAWLFDGVMGLKILKKHKWLYTKDMLENESHIERVRLFIDSQISKRK